MKQAEKAAPRFQPVMLLTIVVVVTLVSGVLHGRMSQRWGEHERMAAAVERLKQVPTEFGPWQLETDLELGKSAIDLLSCQGYVHRGYRNRLTGDFVKVAVMVGPGAKMSIHVPEICYESSNFTLLHERQLLELPELTNKPAFWTVSFQVNDVTQQQLEVAYAWSYGDQWVAPRFPRWSLAAAPVLYKIQASHVQDRAVTDAQRQRVLQSFLADFVPVLRTSLVPTEKSGSASADKSPSAAKAVPARSRTMIGIRCTKVRVENRAAS